MFTLKDLLEDVKQCEGVVLNLGNRIESSRFVRLYSEVYPTAGVGMKTREQIKLDVKTYLKDARWHLPVPDYIPVNPKKKYLLYDFDQNTFSSAFLGEYSQTDEMERLMANVEPKDRHVLMVVDWSERRIIPLLRDENGHRHAVRPN